MGLTEPSFLERMELMGFAPTRTNAERNRSMTDEEMAEWIYNIQADAYKRGMMKTPVVDYPSTYSGWLDWMKRKVTT